MDWTLVLTTLFGVVGGSTITVGILKWIGRIASDQMKIISQKKANEDIEQLKANISINNELIKTSLSAFATESGYSQEKRLNAIENLWEDILNTREFFAPLSTFYSVILPDEYHNPGLADKFNISEVNYESLNQMLETQNGIEKYRPYLGEYIWGLYSTYKSFVGRISFLFLTQYYNNSLKPWYNDVHVKKVVKEVLDQEKHENYKYTNIHSLQKVLVEFEHKILKEFDLIISGKSALDTNLEQATKLIGVASELNTNGVDMKQTENATKSFS
ncbi:hypothetical protein [Paraliobacillus sediminis]|uniref:hypothetical protein n=1 Tax=Paraliobacillus sediminis TaxID=1885916 RepID=UPI000E3EA055|nr:hypothetical protein [Paraliobacillus sediminis]